MGVGGYSYTWPQVSSVTNGGFSVEVRIPTSLKECFPALGIPTAPKLIPKHSNFFRVFFGGGFWGFFYDVSKPAGNNWNNSGSSAAPGSCHNLTLNPLPDPSHTLGIPSPTQGTPSPTQGTSRPILGTPSHILGTPRFILGTPNHILGTPSHIQAPPGHPQIHPGHPQPHLGHPQPHPGHPSPILGTSSPILGTPSHTLGIPRAPPAPSWAPPDPSRHSQSTPSPILGTPSHTWGTPSPIQGCRARDGQTDRRTGNISPGDADPSLTPPWVSPEIPPLEFQCAPPPPSLVIFHSHSSHSDITGELIQVFFFLPGDSSIPKPPWEEISSPPSLAATKHPGHKKKNPKTPKE
ncbi:uncharacterized protein LOC127060912 [Serinus canaria]|uniref:uncharacterized protein LOC127060912 n=1 Tax=Serinus canaria TaxID=9135 RepID=UPI0021CCE243|nr:uncharacterized protein LOC127060912 [Serinus canaria]